MPVADTEWVIRDELEAALDGWQCELAGQLNPNPFREEALALIPLVRQAAKESSRRTEAALRLGLLIGIHQMSPYADHLERIRPDAVRGEKVKKSASEGGKARWTQDEERTSRKTKAVARVLELCKATPYRSRHDICQQVGQELKLSGRTIERYTQQRSS